MKIVQERTCSIILVKTNCFLNHIILSPCSRSVNGKQFDFYGDTSQKKQFAAGKSLKTRVVLKSPCACRVEIVAHLLTSGVNGIHRQVAMA